MKSTAGPRTGRPAAAAVAGRSVVGAAGSRVPAVALTAFARSEDRTRALRAGYAVHVSKPVEPQELLATVASVAGRTGPPGAPGPPD